MNSKGHRSASLALLACIALGACGRDAPREAPEGAARATSLDPAVERVREALPRFLDADIPATARRPEQLSRARHLMQVRDHEAARELLESFLAGEAPAASPERDEATLLLGIVHLEAHRASLSLEPFEQVLAAGPTFRQAPQAFYLYARALADLGRPAAARAAFEADLELFPESGDAWFQLALLDVEAGEPVEARTKLERALASFEAPRDIARAHARLGDLALDADDLEAADRHYQISAEHFPHYEVHYKLARVARARGDDAAADAHERRHEELRAAAQAAPPR